LVGALVIAMLCKLGLSGDDSEQPRVAPMSMVTNHT
jgi:hypothetical protein